MTKTKLRFVVPHTLFSEGLIMLLADTGRFEIDEHPDVLLVDASMMTKEIVGPHLVANPYVKVIVIGHEDAPTLAKMMEFIEIGGAWAYVRASTSAKSLVSIIELTLEGNAVWPAEVLEGLRRVPFLQPIMVPQTTTPCNRLSPRELQLIGGIRRGMSNKEIARETQIADATVKVHVKAILRKLRLQNRTQLAVWAVSNGGNHAEV